MQSYYQQQYKGTIMEPPKYTLEDFAGISSSCSPVL